MVSKQGIEVNLEKLSAIEEMKAHICDLGCSTKKYVILLPRSHDHSANQRTPKTLFRKARPLGKNVQVYSQA